jgi:hypothetical protein
MCSFLLRLNEFIKIKIYLGSPHSINKRRERERKEGRRRSKEEGEKKKKTTTTTTQIHFFNKMKGMLCGVVF